jgi:hypothetical protein
MADTKQIFKVARLSNTTKRVRGNIYLYRGIYFGVNVYLESHVATELTTGAVIAKEHTDWGNEDKFVMDVMDKIDNKIEHKEWDKAVIKYKKYNKQYTYPINNVAEYTPIMKSYELNK